MASSSRCRVFLALALLAVSGIASGQSSPLPGVTIVGAKPMVGLLLDFSGSMGGCDGGTWDANNPPVPLTLFDPRIDQNDNRGGAWWSSGCNGTHDDDPSTGSGDARSQTATVITLSRLEGLKIGVADLLDANDDGVINASDELVLPIYAGLAYYRPTAECDQSGEDPYCIDPLTVQPIGSSFSAIWTSIVGVGNRQSGTSFTPHGPAIAGARARLIAPCFDGVAGGCNLPAEELTGNNDNLSSCRKYYVIHITDGESDWSCGSCAGGGGGGVCPIDGPSMAKRLLYRWEAWSGEATYLGASLGGAIDDVPIYVASIGYGAAVQSVSSDVRGQVNCMGFWGAIGSGGVLDANLDGDANPNTFDFDTTASTMGISITPESGLNYGSGADNNPDTSTNTFCNHQSNFDTDVNDVQTYYGAGYFAANTNALRTALQTVFTSVATGSYSGSAPTVSFTGSGTAAGTAVFTTHYDVQSGVLERYGHLRKYRFVNGQYRDCNNPTGAASNPIVPCWDAAGRAVVNSGMNFVNEFGDTDSTVGYLPGLAERHWTTRRIFTASREAETNYDPNEAQNMSRRPDPATSGRSITNMTAVLAALTTLPPTALSIVSDLGLGPETDLKAWSAWGTIQSGPPTNGVSDAVVTYANSGAYGSISPSTKVDEFVRSALWVAGKPTATYGDNVTKRCVSCGNDNAWSPKLGWPRSSRPVVVGPPVAYTTDVSYTGVSGTDNSGFLETVLTNPYTGSDAVVERTAAYHANGSAPSGTLVEANPCGEGFSGTCKVKNRRKVVYLATNDGMVHAFDERTGHELWAFIPPGTLRKLVSARAGGGNVLLDGSATVRDIKFPSISGTRYADGNWHTVMIYSAGEGGRFYFALDVTNPVDPKFLWEAHDPHMGQTVARVAVGDVNPAGNPLSDSVPGSIIFATSGKYLPADTSRSHTLYSLKPWNGVQAGSRTIEITDLPSTETVPNGIANALVAEPRVVDANLDGYTDRVYFGDLEGRMHKGCDIQSSGQTGAVKLWFDPALYDDPFGTGGCNPAPGQPYSCSGSESDPMGSSLAAAEEAARRELRGPIYHPADVTFKTPNLVVTWGTGDIFNVLVPPTAHKNFIWTVEDTAAGSGSATCAAAVANVCNSSSANSDTSSFGTEGGRNRYVSGSYTFNNVLRVKDVLTAPPTVLAGFLLYPEFERATAATACTSAAYTSRIVARDISDCSGFASGTGPFPTAANVDSSNSVITYNNTLVTGLQVDPKTGALFAQQSAGSGPPNAVVAGALQSQTTTVGWKQLY